MTADIAGVDDAAEGVEVETGPTYTLHGETFRLQDTPSPYSELELAAEAAKGGDTDTPDGLAALLGLVLSCVFPEDEQRLRATFRKNRVETSEMLEIVIACKRGDERPTGLSNDSSDGQPDIEAKPEPSSGVKASERLSGRPDLQLAIGRAKTA